MTLKINDISSPCISDSRIRTHIMLLNTTSKSYHMLKSIDMFDLSDGQRSNSKSHIFNCYGYYNVTDSQKIHFSKPCTGELQICNTNLWSGRVSEWVGGWWWVCCLTCLVHVLPRYQDNKFPLALAQRSNARQLWHSMPLVRNLETTGS